MEIVFHLQADPKLTKAKPPSKEVFSGYSIREYFHFVSSHKIKSEAGIERSAHDIVGLVDDAIRIAHEKEYKEFRALVDAREAALIEQALANPGVPVYAGGVIQPEDVAEVPAAEVPAEEVAEEAPQSLSIGDRVKEFFKGEAE